MLGETNRVLKIDCKNVVLYYRRWCFFYFTLTSLKTYTKCEKFRQALKRHLPSLFFLTKANQIATQPKLSMLVFISLLCATHKLAVIKIVHNSEYLRATSRTHKFIIVTSKRPEIRLRVWNGMLTSISQLSRIHKNI